MTPLAPSDRDLASADLDYPLDPALIATAPAHPRDHARLFVFHRATGAIEHRKVADLAEYLQSGSKMVVNETRVAPLRFVGCRVSDGRQTEGLFLGKAQEGHWIALIKGSKKFHRGDVLELQVSGCGTGDSGAALDRITLHARRNECWEVSFEAGVNPSTVFERSGYTPLPPYILHARKVAAARGEGGARAGGESHDRVDYQTVFAHTSDLPSCAAPTAGLHFTPELLARIDSAGVERVAVELQVGTGTFRPVDSQWLSQHPMHHEHCRVSAHNLLRLEGWKNAPSLVVGTTSVRLLESIPMPLAPDFFANAQAMVAAGQGDGAAMDFVTNILITPGFKFQWTHRLLTNFHLPKSTLLALVGALVGLDQLKELYSIASSERYRFYSFGDAMLILP
ncbi:MAG: S-adenosylmethionine:tRNA ribosyltransferase-isomerase [Phycisphaerales bacterium]|nr:S-adenosylmethionine:tRNA ribosyltransferase-isomerase [Phycisphaerales bacterium]